MQGRVPLPPRPFYPFQRRAIEFLWHRGSGLLAMDAGLGKSLCALTYYFMLKHTFTVRKALIVAPKSVTKTTKHWSDEVKKWFPNMRVVNLSAPREERPKLWAQDGDIYIINYDLLWAEIVFVEMLLRRGGPWLLIADEVTWIKNYSALRSKVVSRISSKCIYRIGLSGTPEENTPLELHSIVTELGIADWGPRDVFRSHFVTNMTRGRLEELHLMFLGVAYRLKKEDSNIGIPDKIVIRKNVELSPFEDMIYQRIRAHLMASADQYKNAIVAAIKSKCTMPVLAWLTFARMYCDSPSLINKSDAISGRFLQIIGVIPPGLTGSKLDVVLETYASIGRGNKVLIFTEFSEMAKLIEQKLRVEYPERKILIATGGRDNMKKVEQFKKEGDVLVSTDCLSFGIQLTEASYVFLVDHFWNPARDDQRIGRTHRIGQKRRVIVYDFVVGDLEKVENYVQRLLGIKRQVTDIVIDGTP